MRDTLELGVLHIEKHLLVAYYQKCYRLRMRVHLQLTAN